jgi:hypothetical protein
MPAKKSAKKSKKNISAVTKNLSEGQVASESSQASSSRPTMLLVLGMHRSGTSVTTRLLDCLGAVNSVSLMPNQADNPRGYFEDFDIYQFNETKLLPSLKNKWYSVGPVDWTQLSAHDRSKLELEALEILRANYTLSNPLSVLKEPRIGVLLPFWLPLLERAGYRVRIVCAVRDPLSVARSLARRDGLSISHSGALYVTYWLSILSNIQSQAVAFVQFNDIFNNASKSLDKVISKLGILPPDDYEKRLHDFSSSFIDESLRHNHFEIKDLFLETDLLPLAIELYESLVAAARDQSVKKTSQFIAEANNTLFEFTPILYHYDHLYLESIKANEMEADLKKLSELNSTLGAKCQQLECALERESLLRGQVADKITDYEQNKERMNQAMIECQNQATQLQEKLDEKDLQLNTSAQDKASLADEITSLQEKLDEKDLQLNTSAQDKASLADEITSLQEKLDEKDLQLNTSAHDKASLADEITSLQEKLDEKDLQLNTSARDKASLADEITSLRENMDERIKELAKLGEMFMAMSSEAEALGNKKDGWATDRGRLADNITNLSNELTTIKGSLAWKLTKPLHR